MHTTQVIHVTTDRVYIVYINVSCNKQYKEIFYCKRENVWKIHANFNIILGRLILSNKFVANSE